MIPYNVHILLTVRKEELRRSSTLVLDTIRTGFPTAKVTLWLNDCHVETLFETIETKTTHPEWIEYLVNTEKDPFWICDGDVIFFDSIEQFVTTKPMMGRYEPSFHEPWTDTFKVDRLHTCLLWLDPTIIRFKMSKWHSKFNSCVLQAQSLIKQCVIPTSSKPLLYDTCAMLYHLVGGEHFTPEQNKCFEHLHCGTYSDLVTNYQGLTTIHKEVCKNPRLAQGLQHEQDKFYNTMKIYASSKY